MDLPVLIETCAPHVSPVTMTALIKGESNSNPYAIGVVGGLLERQPTSKPEALITAKKLKALGYNFSIGLGQVNINNFEQYGLTLDSGFNACSNLKVSSAILEECYSRASTQFKTDNSAVEAALSCYYSGNFSFGFKIEQGQTKSYVNKIKSLVNPTLAVNGSFVVPDLKGGESAEISEKDLLSKSKFSSSIRVKLR